MDQLDGVTHRGQDLRDRVKKQKKTAREKRQILKKARNIGRISLPTAHSFPMCSNMAVAESRQ